MKYIKKFENHEYIGEFWLIRTDKPYMELSLHKIGATQSEIERFNLSSTYKLHDKIYISMRYNFVNGVIDGLNNDNCGWMPGDANGDFFYIKNKFNYMGEVIITDEDIEEYSIKKNIEKYNL